MQILVLDRDGVINYDSDYYIKSPEEWIPIPGSIEAIARLTKRGVKIVVVTNQSGVNRGLYSEAMLTKIHEKMLNMIEAAGGKIEKIYYCPHRPEEKCYCRKPNPGMLEEVMRDFNSTKEELVYVGDSEKDYEAAKAAGCNFVLVRTSNGKQTEKALKDKAKIKVFDNLNQLTEFLFEKNRK
jgi:D-glycero-D-manno-heptose 1,7-bisphosphate phosphatase